MKNRVREANMDLLRIVSMFLILILHADFAALGEPQIKDGFPGITVCARYFIESLSIVAVNVFVLLSGWFTIHPSRNKFIHLLFQIFFINITGVCVGLLLGENWTIGKLINSIFCLDAQLWFCQAYILLYLLSPVLNYFTEYSPPHLRKTVLVSFYFFQSIYGWIFQGSAEWFCHGYSTISFIGLYLLGYELSNNRGKLKKLDCFSWLVIYFVCAIIGSVMALGLNGSWNKLPYQPDMYSYTSPFVIISAVSLLMFFSRLSFKSYFVSKVAVSVFAVYLFHIGNFIWPIVSCVWRHLYNNYSYPIYLLISTLFSLLIYVFCILIDRVRLIIWHKVTNCITYENHNNSSHL